MNSAVLKITSVPPGEAPAWVREQWVGLSLPLAQQSRDAHSFRTFGVLSQPKGRFRQLIARLLGRVPLERGYVVESSVAIDLLAQGSSTAADWWRANTPDLLQPGQYFLFQESVGYVAAKDAP